MQVNGAAALLVEHGDKVIVASFAAYEAAEAASHAPIVVHVDEENRPIEVGSDPSILLSEVSPNQEALI